MNTAHAIFGGLALIAAAIFVGQADELRAQAIPEHHEFRLMTPSTQGVAVYVYRIDAQTGQVSVCFWNPTGPKTPECTPWSKKD